jgi:hypothetical protein
MFVLPSDTGVTVTFVPVEFSGTNAVGGSEMTLGSKPLKLTRTPPGPAGAPSAIVRVCGALVKFKGFGLSVIFVPLAVIVTVEGALFVNPSLTINCAT